MGKLTTVKLEVEPREDTGKNACRRMRATGKVPGNVYGLDRPPFKVAVNPRRIEELLHVGSGVNTIFSLALVGEGRTRDAMIKELQRDPVSEQPVHVDFIRVDVSKTMRVSIPVHLEGTPEGVKNEGGVIDFVHREIEVECLPSDIPEYLTIDVSNLHINQHVSVGDIETPGSVEVLEEPGRIVAVVVAPKAEEEAVAVEEVEEGAEAAEGDAAEGAKTEGDTADDSGAKKEG